MAPQQVMKTICLTTRDAIERDDSKMVFDLKIDNPRTRGLKLALGSLEFPMVQYSVEEEWSRLYASEGIDLDETSNTIVFKFNAGEEFTVRLPQRLNAIQSWKTVGAKIVAKCTQPHCLDSMKNITWGEVEIAASPFGRLSLHDFYNSGTLEMVSATEFAIPNVSGDVGVNLLYPNTGMLYIPTIPSPTFLCTLLNAACDALDVISLTFAYRNDNVVHIDVANRQDEKVVVRWTNNKLCKVLGIGNSELVLLPNERSRIPTGEFGVWDYVRVEPGWYAPAHRPMCTGQPLRFAQEVENAFNRLFFPLPERVQNGQITSHYLVFVDPCGHTHMTPVAPGRYSPQTLCSHLEIEMTRLAEKTTNGVTFTVEHIDDYFMITCEVQTGDIVSNAPFSLLLNHPMQFDPSKLGFPAQPLNGSSVYRATIPTHFPRTDRAFYGSTGKAFKNVYRVSEIGHQKRLRIHSTTAPVLSGLIQKYNFQQSILTMRTYMAQLPYAHGYRPGDIVKLSRGSAMSLFEYDSANDAWQEASADACSLSSTWGSTAVVLKVDDIQTDVFPMCTIHLRVRQATALTGCIGNLIQMHSTPEPFNMCFTLPRTLKPEMIGFSPNVILWGRDGSVDGGGNLIPPFDARAVHSLDHPDYVIMTLDEGRGTHLQHTFGNQNKSIFAKIVLYPLARELGMLPKDCSLVGSSSLSRFCINFLNPDGSPYKFHGVEFSFSLNIIDIIGE
jgi:hypothetical protein